MFLRQQIALEIMLPEARKRIKEQIEDGSEMFDGELRDALRGIDDT